MFAYRYGSGSRAVLFLPSLGQSADVHRHVARALASDDTVCYLPDLRGHGLSQGRWSLFPYRADVAYWIASLRSYSELYVIGHGLSASTMLEYDHQAHELDDLPPMPDGMLLLGPLFSGREILPEGMFRMLNVRLFRKSLNCRLHDPEEAWEEIARYGMHPCRIQTPATVLVAADEQRDPLDYLSGEVKVRRVPWLHHALSGRVTRAELARHTSEIRDELQQLFAADDPIRFRLAR